MVVSVLYREPMWLKYAVSAATAADIHVSVLYREPMWLKFGTACRASLPCIGVSVLYREPMWLKYRDGRIVLISTPKFQCSTVSRCG